MAELFLNESIFSDECTLVREARQRAARHKLDRPAYVEQFHDEVLDALANGFVVPLVVLDSQQQGCVGLVGTNGDEF